MNIAIAAVVAILTGADASWNRPGTRQADALTFVLVAVSVAAVLLRRRFPVPVAAVCGGVLTAWYLLGHRGELLNLPSMVALYTVAVTGGRGRTLLVGAVAVPWSAGLAWLAVDRSSAPVAEMLWPVAALLLGEVIRGRQELRAEYAAREARATADWEREADQRIQQERLRVAREFHDVVAHTMAAVNVQMGVAAAAFDQHPATARTALLQARASPVQRRDRRPPADEPVDREDPCQSGHDQGGCARPRPAGRVRLRNRSGPGRPTPAGVAAVSTGRIAGRAAIGRRRVDEVLDQVGLSTVAGKRAKGLSLGMAQRLGIAAALLGDPAVLILDEPVNGLDTDGIRWMRGLLRGLAAQGRTVFLSSHLMTEMELTADHLIVIGAGRLIADTDMRTFIEDNSPAYALARSPQADRLAAVLRAGGGRVRVDPDGALRVSGIDAATIGEIASAQRIPLHELSPRLSSLEDVSTRMTGASVEFGPRGVTP